MESGYGHDVDLLNPHAPIACSVSFNKNWVRKEREKVFVREPLMLT